MAYRLILKGRVQGVGGRAYCRSYGRKLGIAGSATNLPDGSVRVLLATDDEKLAREYALCLQNDPLGLQFYGHISSIELDPWSGPVAGDYNF